jgi:hypothetical protein
MADQYRSFLDRISKQSDLAFLRKLLVYIMRRDYQVACLWNEGRLSSCLLLIQVTSIKVAYAFVTSGLSDNLKTVSTHFELVFMHGISVNFSPPA